MSNHLLTIEKFPKIRILVIGDLILDHYVFGHVDRVSPEAPVPVVHVKEDSFRLGGAANACANVGGLGAKVDVIGMVGKDQNGSKLRDMLSEIGANVNGLILDHGRPTIIKTRVIAQHQQIVRIDREAKDAIDGEFKEEIVSKTQSFLPKVNAVLLSDYDKGLLNEDVLKAILSLSKEQGIPVVVDPKMENFWHYKGATLITPNTKEASEAFGREITDDTSLLEAGKGLLERLELDALLITRGEYGMSLFESVDNAQPKVTHIPTVAREVYDVTGAGDTVTAVFTLALSTGASMLDAAKIANCAAGIVVSELGTGSVTQEELIDALKEMEMEDKLCE